VNRRSFVAALIAAVGAAGAASAAQRTPTVPAVDPELEAFAKHNLEVAQHYYKKKAWKGVANRLEEVVATYPEYTRIDEVYYLLAMSYKEMERVDAARDTFKALLDARPESEFAKKARIELDTLEKHGPSPQRTDTRS
jgi:predicted Zn-dependent protease